MTNILKLLFFHLQTFIIWFHSGSKSLRTMSGCRTETGRQCVFPFVHGEMLFVNSLVDTAWLSHECLCFQITTAIFLEYISLPVHISKYAHTLVYDRSLGGLKLNIPTVSTIYPNDPQIVKSPLATLCRLNDLDMCRLFCTPWQPDLNNCSVKKKVHTSPAP